MMNISDFAPYIIDKLGFGVTVIDAQTHQIIYVNSKLLDETGYNYFEIVGKSCHNLLCPAEKGKCPISDLGNKVDNSERKMILADGTLKPIIKTVVPLMIRNKNYFIESVIDNTDRKAIHDQQIKYLAFHDYLTGIYNRAFFEEELHRLDTERQLPLTLVLGDVNGLKIINDAFGHEKGDELLIKVANILKETFRREDIVARWGGDEFIAILPKTDLNETLNIMPRINKKLKIESTQTLPLSVAFGLATKEKSIQKIDGLIKIAEDKMYKHKMMEHQSTHSKIISSLGKTLEERDYETAEHVKRMKSFAIDLGTEINLSDETLDEIALLAALHDIGKISVADDIIFKPRSLTQEEWEVMKRHPEIGYHIAESSIELMPIAKGILHHHEWWNGEGYPKGLKGENIPLIARIISIVDAFDAMTNDRPYRKALSTQEAIKELKRGSGSQFDPNLVPKFISIVEKTVNVVS
jgi:diguanylate cyclase (GGDEF)-like protein